MTLSFLSLSQIQKSWPVDVFLVQKGHKMVQKGQKIVQKGQKGQNIVQKGQQMVRCIEGTAAQYIEGVITTIWHCI